MAKINVQTRGYDRRERGGNPLYLAIPAFLAGTAARRLYRRPLPASLATSRGGKYLRVIQAAPMS
jgi:hypothetical protein